MIFQLLIFGLFALIILEINAWELLPNIPTGRRSQYLLLNENGGYKYGYDTGEGHAGKQNADESNQVTGHYFYKNAAGKQFDLKYSSGVQGFVPENLKSILDNINTADSLPTTQPIAYIPHSPSNNFQTKQTNNDESNTGDSSYSFTIDTDTYKRQETADRNNNVQGKYSYVNDAGKHDLSYIAGSNTGFVATSGSLSKPNELNNNIILPINTLLNLNQEYGSIASPVRINKDGSYEYSYNTGNHKHSQSGDSLGNVQGMYSYNDNAGEHNLQYIADAKTGFKVTGGNLYNTNNINMHNYAPLASSNYYSTGPNIDGSYSFGYKTADSSRDEFADAKGDVIGSYSYVNENGKNDLTYVVTANSGFKVTGGSLASPVASTNNAFPSLITYGPNIDGSYAFNYQTGDSSRQESKDTSGNVEGSYSYTNENGINDLSYLAGVNTGFIVTGGKVSPSTITTSGDILKKPYYASITTANNPPNFHGMSLGPSPDGSYSFSYQNEDSSRRESADRNNNVHGSYSYNNENGYNDLTYIASAKTGFKVTGGSLASPTVTNIGDTYGSILSKPNYAPISSGKASPNIHGLSSGPSADGSYSFSYKTDDATREESGDSQGNVKGSYSYKNENGVNDLTYIAGAKSGFKVTGGSLSQSVDITESTTSTVDNTDSTESTINADSSTTFKIADNESSTDIAVLDDQADTGDASYSFIIDTNEYKRREMSDSKGNVQGSFAYIYNAGKHDLSYIARADTGFVATGGSLSDPDAIAKKITGLSYNKETTSTNNRNNVVNKVANVNVGNSDVPKSFIINTEDYKKQEIGDASGNIQRSYSEGVHDLNDRYDTGSSNRFLVVGGSLSDVPSFNNIVFDRNTADASSYAFEGATVKTYLPPSNDYGKFGYIYDTKN